MREVTQHPLKGANSGPVQTSRYRRVELSCTDCIKFDLSETAARQLNQHGSYNFRQTKFKDFSRTFQGHKTIFQGLFNKSTFFVSFFSPKTLIHNPFQFSV